jgi:hypothetical protein
VRLRLAWGMLAVAWLLAQAAATSAGEILPTEILQIKSVVSDPTAYHRRTVKLQGKVKNLAKADASNQTSCNQDFTLEDETGAIPVYYIVRCEISGQKAIQLLEGEQVIVEGSVEALSGNVHSSDGKSFGSAVMASRIIRPK